jgi:hypothetical protein
MRKRGAIELSMSFLVVILISVIIFGFGIRFIYNLTKQANEIQSLSVEDIDRRILNMVCEGNAKVCLGTDRKTIRKEDFDVFGIKIVNAGDSEDFLVKAEFAKGITKTGGQITSSTLEINPPPNMGRSVTIAKNDEAMIGIGIGVPANAIPGTYIFNVVITSSGQPYVPIQKLYVEVP